MSGNSRMKNRMCLILISILIILGAGTVCADAGMMPSCSDMGADRQSITQTTLEAFSLLNPEEVSATSSRNPIVSESLRLTQLRSGESVLTIQCLMILVPSILSYFFIRFCSVILCAAQGHSVIIHFIHDKDGRKGNFHFLFA